MGKTRIPVEHQRVKLVITIDPKVDQELRLKTYNRSRFVEEAIKEKLSQIK